MTLINLYQIKDPFTDAGVNIPNTAQQGNVFNLQYHFRHSSTYGAPKPVAREVKGPYGAPKPVAREVKGPYGAPKPVAREVKGPYSALRPPMKS